MDEEQVTTYSQVIQDLEVVRHFNGKRDGYFVDIGAYDGIHFSNTYKLEKEYGWKGLCFEPNPRAYDELKDRRPNSVCLKNAVYSESGKHLQFTIFKNNILNKIPEMLSGISTHLRDHLDKQAVKEVIDVTTITLTDALRANNAPKVIDYLSVDTEGSEVEVLKGIDFGEYSFRYICIEHNYEEPKRELIKSILTSHGYTYVKEAHWDDVYAKDC